MNEKKYDLEDRLVKFAAEIVFLCKELPADMTVSYYGNQLLRSSGSAALNFGETQGCHTKRDNVNKLAITLKELKETRVNLSIMTKIDYGNLDKRQQLLDEVEQLIRIIATIIKKKQYNSEIT